MAHVVVGTAGHIDHGKTSLVRALTGMDTDTLREERERQITIDLGFAFLGDDVTIIDVPGHERFIKNMVSGVATIDYVLLVVAADDGVMPQTREHLDILRLLGVERGMVVVTKADMVDGEWLALMQDELASFLRGSFLEGAPAQVVDSLSGRGIPALKAALAEALGALPPRAGRGVFRQVVDRVFNVKGHGTVLTGTVLGGELRVGEEVEIMPGGLRARVRGLQVHGQAVEGVRQGDRAALNVQGLARGELRRGSWVAAPGVLKSTALLDARLRVLPGELRLRHRDRVRVHLGTAELIGRALLLGRKSLEPGEEGFAQLLLEEETAALVGDRFVIRRYSPPATLGGGMVVDPDPRRHRPSAGQVVERLERIADGDLPEQLAGLLDDPARPVWQEADFRARTGAGAAELEEALAALAAAGRVRRAEWGSRVHWIAAARWAEAGARLLERLEQWHAAAPELPGMPLAQLRSELFAAAGWQAVAQPALDELLAGLLREDRVRVEGKGVALAGHQPSLSPELARRAGALVAWLEGQGYGAPRLEEMAAGLGEALPEVRRLLAVALGDGRLEQAAEQIFLTRERHQAALATLRGLCRRQAEGFTVGQAGAELGASRRFMVPYLEALDRRGVTRREGNFRTMGEAGAS
jgi:selenocysteine-specific elongation factor